MCCDFPFCWKRFNELLNFFYWSQLKIRGPRPSTSVPLVICATHWTGICDTQISYVTNTRPSRLVAKDGLVNSGPLGPVARAARVIPVFRKVDHQDENKDKRNEEVELQQKGLSEEHLALAQAAADSSVLSPPPHNECCPSTSKLSSEEQPEQPQPGNAVISGNKACEPCMPPCYCAHCATARHSHAPRHDLSFMDNPDLASCRDLSQQSTRPSQGLSPTTQ